MSVSPLQWEEAIQQVLRLVNEREQMWQSVLGGSPLILLRDWVGRLHMCIDSSDESLSRSESFSTAILAIHNELNGLSAASAVDAQTPDDLVRGLVMFRSELFDPESIWNSQDKVRLQKTPVHVYLVDRQDKESDWLRTRLAACDAGVRRAAFFGVKGGVGRSTALVGLAMKLGELGHRVLVVDTDFESPGLSSSLLSPAARPDYGLVDWFALDALQDASDSRIVQLGSLVEASPLNKQLAGRILVAPAFGAKTDSYVSKLGRLYASTTTGTYAERLNKVLTDLESEHRPDITLIDSRAGIDDTAAVTITRLGAQAFLFAVNTSQTWDAYELLFRHLQRHPSIHRDDDFRPGFHVVSALTPDPAVAPAYFDSFRQRAYDLFQEIYDEIAPGDDGLDAFNFDFDDSEAPHNPWRIRWDDSLRAFDPVRFEEHMNSELLAKVFGEFTKNALAWFQLGAPA